MNLRIVVTEPGIYELDEATYHADPVPGGSLSSSGARKLLPPSCPAIFAYERRNQRPATRALDLGTAAHKLVLGAGWPFVVIDADNYRTKAAQQARDEAHAAGATPILNPEYDQVRAMAAALGAHPLASAALDSRRGGKPEQSLFCQGESGVWLRARLDWMPDPDGPMRPVIFDYKTTTSADPTSFAKSMANYGYDVQAAFYADIYQRLTGVDAPCLFIAQDKEPPYLVSVLQPDADAMKAGREKYMRAIEIFRDCTEAGIWPGYTRTDEVTTISLPRWARPREDDYL